MYITNAQLSLYHWHEIITKCFLFISIYLPDLKVYTILFGLMKMVVESIVLHIGPKSSIDVELGWDLVTVKVRAFYSHHFHPHQIIQWTLVNRNICISYVSPLFIQVFPLICLLSVVSQRTWVGSLWNMLWDKFLS